MSTAEDLVPTSVGPGILIDPRGHRFGAAVSALLLTIAWLAGSPWLVGVAFVTRAISAGLGLRYSVYGWAWRRLVRILRLPSVEPEHEYGPRFAQTLGSAVLAVALVAFALGALAVGWVAVGAVAMLQVILAVTGFCLGCRLYFLRWWLPGLATAWWERPGR